MASTLAATGGCYRRVVSSKGFGASTTPVHEGNSVVPGAKSKTALDRRIKR